MESSGPTQASIPAKTDDMPDARDDGLAIVAIEAHAMEGTVDPPWRLSTTTYDTVRATFVEITLANGTVGWGECLVREAPGASKAIIDDVFAPILIGRSAARVQSLWGSMYRLFRTRGHSRGIVVEALAGVDIALWDALARSLGRSIRDLVFAEGRTSIPCYASSIMVSDERTTAADAERLVADGYNSIKIKVGQDVRLDARRVHLVREIIGPERELMVDINCSFNLTMALAFISAVESAGIAWIEEPVLPDDLPSYRRLAAAFPTVPLAAGESEFTAAGFREYCSQGILAVLQPDVARAGGITGMLRIAHLADAYNIELAPHVGASGGICAAASIQISAALSNFRIYEHMYLPHPLQDVFTVPPPAAVRGRIAVPSGPGIGYEIDRDKVGRLMCVGPE